MYAYNIYILLQLYLVRNQKRETRLKNNRSIRDGRGVYFRLVRILTWPEFVLNLYSLSPGLLDTPGDLLGVNDGATIIHDTGFSVITIIRHYYDV